ncbi:MAG TPA: bacitracin ABC transporter permease, partial [Spirochaetia bacterium]|nr:bacitracin ABC transporter permease [Spirochaetia bacterium]
MTGLIMAVWAESLKTVRAKIFWISIGMFVFIAVMLGVLVIVAAHPEIFNKDSLLSAKASIFGSNDWAGFFRVLIQTVAMLGLFGFGFVASWVFGREYADRTAKDLLALPVARLTVVVAKLMIVLLWCVLL